MRNTHTIMADLLYCKKIVEKRMSTLSSGSPLPSTGSEHCVRELQKFPPLTCVIDHSYTLAVDNEGSGENAELNSVYCKLCKNTFASKWSLDRHNFVTHKIATAKRNAPKKDTKFTCTHCAVSFTAKKSLLRHTRSQHANVADGTPIPPQKSPKQSSLAAGIHLTFKTMEDFHDWKTQMEKTTKSSFVLSSGARRRLNGDTVRYYMCHRSGTYKSSGAGKAQLKANGSCKLGGKCPAAIKTVTKKLNDNQPSSIRVTYNGTHSHKMELGRLKLTKSEKDVLAAQLQAGVSMDHILKNIYDNFNKDDRLSYTTRKDLHNIVKSYGINYTETYDGNEARFVDKLVAKLQSERGNPVLLYKLQGETLPEYPVLQKDDFVLAIMNIEQMGIFEKYGNSVISIDSTHGTNKYSIQLTSVMIHDERGEGFLVAFMFSNRQTEDVFTVFFNEMKARFIPQPETFMSDDYPFFYNSWKSVFGPVKYNIICAWHVKRAWASNMLKISSPLKKVDVMLDLTTMQEELDENAFEILLKDNVEKFLKDPDTKSFGHYFEANYAQRAKKWAACYRTGARIDTNLTIEMWHKDLKDQVDVTGKDTTIMSAMHSLQKKLMNRVVSIIRGKLSGKLYALRKRHNASDRLSLENIVQDCVKRSWSVPCATKSKVFTVQERSEGCATGCCDLRCDVCDCCVHKFSCSCPDSQVCYNMCKHIHLVCRLLRTYEESPRDTAQDTFGDEEYLIIDQDGRIEPDSDDMDTINMEMQKHLDKAFDDEKQEIIAQWQRFLNEIQSCTTSEELTIFTQTMSAIELELQEIRSRKGLKPLNEAPNNIDARLNFVTRE